MELAFILLFLSLLSLSFANRNLEKVIQLKNEDIDLKDRTIQQLHDTIEIKNRNLDEQAKIINKLRHRLGCQ